MRIIVGALFVGHGLQKLAGKFGGHGLEATGQAFESLGLPQALRRRRRGGALAVYS